jgi:hypothetical protein
MTTHVTLPGYRAEHAMFQGLPDEQLELIASQAAMVAALMAERLTAVRLAAIAQHSGA